MKFDWRKTSAYQGRGWKVRGESLHEELAHGDLWSSARVNSEWGRLEAVALYRPGGELRAIKSPQRVQHLRAISPARLNREYKTLVKMYRSFGVKVIELDPSLLPKSMQPAPPNLMFVRDLFFNTTEGCVIGRMASRVRAGEEKFASASLAAQGLPIRATIAGRGLFEGADALWLDKKTVLIGVGNRTNAEGFAQVKSVLAGQGVRVLATKLPKGVQHLLGVLQVPAPKVAVVRTQIVSRAFLSLLQKRGFRIVPVVECDDVQVRQGMNFVTLEAGRIIMASGCPELRGWFEAAGLKIAAEVDISQLCNAAGGLACATGIVGRRMVK